MRSMKVAAEAKTREVHALSLKENSPRLLVPKHEMTTSQDEEGSRWAGVIVTVVGVMLMALSFALDEGLL